MKLNRIEKCLLLILAAVLACGCWHTAVAEEEAIGSPVFHWNIYDARFAFATTETASFGLDDTIERFFPSAAGNTLFVRLEAVEGKLADGYFDSRLFRLVLPDGTMSEPLMYQVANTSDMGGIQMPDALQDYYHLIYNLGSLTPETLGEGSIAVYENVDGEPVAIISLADVPPYNPDAE